jgi:hypothetical protein
MRAFLAKDELKQNFSLIKNVKIPLIPTIPALPHVKSPVPSFPRDNVLYHME